jgi:membrane-associated protein
MFEIFNIPHIISTYGYVGIFLIIFLESGIFFPLPGDSLLFTAGIFAGSFGFNLYILTIIAFFSTFLGGLLGYFVGENLIRFQDSWFGRKFLQPKHVAKAHEFFEKYGVFAVTFARFIPIVRTFVPIVAGVAKMDYKKFFKWSIVGSLLWGAGVTLLGFFLGKVFPGIKDSLWIIVVIVVLISFVPIIIEFLRRKRS